MMIWVVPRSKGKCSYDKRHTKNKTQRCKELVKVAIRVTQPQTLGTIKSPGAQKGKHPSKWISKRISPGASGESAAVPAYWLLVLETVRE